MELRDGVNTNLRWNHIELLAGRSPEGRDVLVLMGPEPDMNWRRFSNAVGDIAVELGVTHMIGVRGVPVRCAAHSARLDCPVRHPSVDVLANVPFARSSVRRACGYGRRHSNTRCTHRKIPALGIWAQVPHYVSSMTYPAVVGRLARRPS